MTDALELQIKNKIKELLIANAGLVDLKKFWLDAEPTDYFHKNDKFGWIEWAGGVVQVETQDNLETAIDKFFIVTLVKHSDPEIAETLNLNYLGFIEALIKANNTLSGLVGIAEVTNREKQAVTDGKYGLNAIRVTVTCQRWVS